MRRSRWWSAGVLLVPLVLFGTVGAATASAGTAATTGVAGEPPGTVALASGDTTTIRDARVLGVARGDVIYTYQGPANADVYLAAPISGGPASVLSLPDIQFGIVVVADTAVGYDTYYQQHWYSLPDGAPIARQPNWVTPSPDGGLYTAPVEGGGPTHLYDQNASSLAITDLGALSGGSGTLLSGIDGVAVVGSDSIQYVAYAAPGVVRTLDIGAAGSGLSCQTISSTALGCRGAGVVRVPLDGSPAVVTPTSARIQGGPVVTATTTAWTETAYPRSFLLSVPAAGGHVTRQRGILGGSIAASDSALYVEAGTTASNAGIDETTAAGAPMRQVVPTGAVPVAASALALTVGRAAWEDNQSPADPVRSRTVTPSGGGLSLGTARATGSARAGTDFPRLAASGSRTAWSSAGGIMVSYPGGTEAVPGLAASDQVVAFSGARLTYRVFTSSHSVVLDLASGKSVDVTTAYGAYPYYPVAQWGPYVAYALADGSIWRADLTSRGAPVQVAPAFAGGQPYSVELHAYGDWVGWNENQLSLTTYGASGYRNATTLAPAVSLVGDQFVAGLSVGGVTVPDGTGFGLLPYAGGPVSAIAPATQDGSSGATGYVGALRPVVDGSTVGWIGTDGTPEVAPLPQRVVNQPRSLGAPFVTPRVPAGGAWSLDLPTSAALTTCSVAIRLGAQVVRTVPCGAASALGEVTATWNGHLTGGGAAVPGTYTWRVTAADADGPLLGPRGRATATSGTFTITPS